MKTYKVYIESKWYDVDILDSNQDFVNVSVEGTLFKVLIKDINDFSVNTPVLSRIKNLVKNTFFNTSSEGNITSSNNLDLNKIFPSPLPGMIISVSVDVGDEIVIGDEICVLEAMKMQQSLKATWSGTVSSVEISSGDKVTTGQILVTIN
ncbi:MAG: biotin/lipoyl-containing protein [Dehalococcoidia bacterium]